MLIKIAIILSKIVAYSEKYSHLYISKQANDKNLNDMNTSAPLVKQELKTTVLNASITLAEDLSSSVINLKTPSGKNIFKRTETDNGFKIYLPMINSKGVLGWCRCFELIKTPCSIQYDERVFSIKAD